MADRLQELCAFLENYWCRDLVFRTAQFSTALLAGLTESEYSQFSSKMNTLYGSLANMRIICRFLDDIPALAHTLKTWQNLRNDTPVIVKPSDLLSSLCSLFYYPAEHLAWLADNKLLPLQSTSLWTIALVLWGLPLYSNLVRSALALIDVNSEMKLLWRREKSSNSLEKQVAFLDQRQYVGRTTEMQRLMSRRFHIILSIIQSLCDLMNAVHWLPKDIFWAGKLPLAWVGVFGTLSSIISLYKILSRQAV